MARKSKSIVMVEEASVEPVAGQPEQIDLFNCEIVNWSLKDDIASMTVPLFALSKKPETEIKTYRRGSTIIRITPSADGMATVFDKDLLLYITSQLVEAINQGKPVSNTVYVDSMNFLASTERGDGRKSYELLVGMLRRLKGTNIETNIETGGVRQTKGFGLIDNYEIKSSSTRKGKGEAAEDNDQNSVTRVFGFTVTLSEWFMNSLLNMEVLTLDRGYFQLSRSIDRRLYETGRKHCGDAAFWKCDMDLLAEKIGYGSGRTRAYFRQDLRHAIKEDNLPSYRIALDRSKTPEDVVFITKDSRKLTKKLTEDNLFGWYESLEKRIPT